MPTKLPSGKWRGTYRPEGQAAQVRRTFEKYKHAVAWEDEQRTKVRRGEHLDPEDGKVTFAEYFEDYATGAGWTPGSARAARLSIALVPFADMPMRLIRETHAKRWINLLHEKDLAPGTIRTRVGYVRAVFAQAVRERVIASSPFVGLDRRIPKRAKAKDSMRLPSAEQVGALVRAADPSFVAFVGLCALGGLRLGEAAGLRVSDVNFFEKTIKIDRQIQRENGGSVRVCAPKYDSHRVIDAPDGLIHLLSEHVRLHCPGAAMDRWMFPGEGPWPLHQNSAAYWWRKTKRSAGVDGLRLHDLRHFYASGLIAAGLDLPSVCAALGHRNERVTISTYTHLWPKSGERTRAAATALAASVFAVEPRLSHERAAK